MESQTHNSDQVRDLCLRIDDLLSHVESNFSVSRELALVKTKLQEAKMWAGQELGHFEDANAAPEVPAEPTPEATEPAPVASEAIAGDVAEVVVEPAQAPLETSVVPDAPAAI